MPKTWDPADRSFRKTTSGVSRLAGQAGTQATDPTPAPLQNRVSQAGSTTHILPADSVRDISMWVESLINSQINLICALLETASPGMLRGRSRGR